MRVMLRQIFSLLFLLLGLPFAAARLSPVVTVTAGLCSVGCLRAFWVVGMKGLGHSAAAAQHVEARRLLAQVSDEERQAWATAHPGLANTNAFMTVMGGMGL